MTIDKPALKAMAEHVIALELAEDQPIDDAWNEFEAAANPAAILALLAEIDSVTNDRDYCRRIAAHNKDVGESFQEECDRLKADNEALRKALGGMLFAFDDGVGHDWSELLLDHARKLCQAAEFKP